MKNLVSVIITILLFATFVAAQTGRTPNTLRIDKGKKGQPAVPADMKWMAGNWVGKAFGGSVKEVWTATDDGRMMGMFVLVKDEKPVFYEFMTFAVKNGELFLKLKHFTSEMVGWEEKEKTVDFRFIKREGNRYYFYGLTFENAGKNDLNIYLALRQKDKSFKEEVFRMKRVD